jgi:hypothetical protein
MTSTIEVTIDDPDAEGPDFDETNQDHGDS